MWRNIVNVYFEKNGIVATILLSCFTKECWQKLGPPDTAGLPISPNALNENRARQIFQT